MARRKNGKPRSARWLKQLDLATKHVVAVQWKQYIDEGKVQDAYNYIIAIITDHILPAWKTKLSKRFIAQPAIFILQEPLMTIDPTASMDSFLGSKILNNIISHHALNEHGNIIMPFLPLDLDHFTATEYAERVNLMISNSIQYNSGRVEEGTFMFDLVDVVQPGKRDFMNGEATGVHELGTFLRDFQPAEGMLGYMTPAQYSERIGVDGSRKPESMPDGYEGFEELVRSRARILGVEVQEDRCALDSPCCHPSHFYPPNKPFRLTSDEFLEGRRAGREGSEVVHAYSWNSEVGQLSIDACLARLAALGEDMDQNDLGTLYDYFNDPNMSAPAIDESYTNLYETQRLYTTGQVHKLAKEDFRSPNGLLGSVVDICNDRLKADAGTRQREHYEADCNLRGNETGCARPGCDLHLSNRARAGIQLGRYFEDPIQKVLDFLASMDAPAMVCGRCLVVTELLMRDPIQGGLGLSAPVALVLQQRNHSFYPGLALRLYGCWVPNCRFARLPGMRLKHDPLNGVPFVCFDCAEHREQDMLPVLRQPTSSTGAHSQPADIVYNTQSFVRCGTAACHAYAIDPETNTSYVRSEGSTLGYIGEGGRPVCRKCAWNLDGVLTGNERIDQEYQDTDGGAATGQSDAGHIIGTSDLDIMAVDYMKVRRWKMSDDQRNKFFWRAVKRLTHGGIVDGEVVGCDLARRAFRKRLRSFSKKERDLTMRMRELGRDIKRRYSSRRAPAEEGCAQS